MRQTVLLDTGPLISFLAAGLGHHEWVVEQWKRLKPPMLTCEAVLTEAAFLLKREGVDTDSLFALLERGVIRVALEIEDQAADLRTLMRRYRNRPMSLADACL
ncbi:MAG TPA: pilus assembly protein, partial [Verrucomicrobiales bacterium]|nr:pilus assembly protein [Verrucomicrobiales bacterium]